MTKWLAATVLALAGLTIFQHLQMREDRALLERAMRAVEDDIVQLERCAVLLPPLERLR